MQQLLKLTGWGDKTVLYVGDSMYSDWKEPNVSHGYGLHSRRGADCVPPIPPPLTPTPTACAAACVPRSWIIGGIIHELEAHINRYQNPDTLALVEQVCGSRATRLLRRQQPRCLRPAPRVHPCMRLPLVPTCTDGAARAALPPCAAA